MLEMEAGPPITRPGFLCALAPIRVGGFAEYRTRLGLAAAFGYPKMWILSNFLDFSPLEESKPASLNPVNLMV